ncbi:1-deoxy-D-xylulose 5-phosphate reductoisomerase [Lachnospiraceae bacterium RM5]|nr:1-deoxy-D-xylulose 5-phosphate reductoisomerase [Lachnospiraceae bacterium RM5]
MKDIIILGSTGSIGCQALDIVREYKDDLRVVGLAVLKNIDLLEKQIREFKPLVVCVYDEEKALKLKDKVKDLDVEVLTGMDGLIKLSSYEKGDILLTAIVGMIGIRPTIAGIESGKDIALANKETLVCAGHIIMNLAKEKGVSILPVDSEHSAIFQSLRGNDKSQVNKIILTASGGPFRGYTKEMLKDVKLADALKHPNWSMGKKITVDSSTMVNKGLEVIEARWLFDTDFDNIEVVIQPQSVIHSMVEYDDGAVIAQLGTPDMKLPIQYAFFYPDRKFLKGDRLNFYELKSIDFYKPDMEVFSGIKLAYKAGKTGGTMPTVFNAANEFAVAEFIDEKIKYTDIVEMIEYAMDNHKVIDNPTVDDILETEKAVYELLTRKVR